MKTSRIILLLVVFSGIHCTLDKNSNCKKIKTGRFHIYSSYNGYEYTINRSDSFQIEISETTGQTTKWKINWINDCEYQLIYLKALPSPNPDTLKVIYKDLTYKIVGVGENYYVYTNKTDDNFTTTDTAWTIAKY